jgi:hypothetical protein
MGGLPTDGPNMRESIFEAIPENRAGYALAGRTGRDKSLRTPFRGERTMSKLQLAVTQIPLREGTGKTIQATAEGYMGNSVLLVFTDNTFACVRAEDSDGDIGLLLDAAFDHSDYCDGDLVEAGVCTQEAMNAYNAERKEEKRSSQEARERAAYERLKAKYG